MRNHFYKGQTPIFGRMGETPMGEGGMLMTALPKASWLSASPMESETILPKIAFT